MSRVLEGCENPRVREHLVKIAACYFSEDGQLSAEYCKLCRKDLCHSDRVKLIEALTIVCKSGRPLKLPSTQQGDALAGLAPALG
jgi:hypothetical protein